MGIIYSQCSEGVLLGGANESRSRAPGLVEAQEARLGAHPDFVCDSVRDRLSSNYHGVNRFDIILRGPFPCRQNDVYSWC